jgi:hypothetical protein
VEYFYGERSANRILRFWAAGAWHTRHKEHGHRWRALISEQQESGQIVSAFCRAHGLGDGQFYGWKKLLRQQEAEPFVARRQARRCQNTRNSALAAPVQLPLESVSVGSRWFCFMVQGLGSGVFKLPRLKSGIRARGRQTATKKARNHGHSTNAPGPRGIPLAAQPLPAYDSVEICRHPVDNSAGSTQRAARTI